MDDIAGRVALITGGASGIGLGMAQAFIAAGVRVAIADIDEAALGRAAAALGAAAMPVALDITSATSWETALDAVEARLGPIGLLCNNAGLGQGQRSDGRPVLLAEMPEAVWRLVVETNITGTFLGVRAAVPRMVAAARGGHVVNTASMAGLIAPAGLGAYAASKYAVVGLSESLRAELAPHGIGVSVLCPGAVSTNFYVTSAVRRDAVMAAEATRDFAAGRTDSAPRMSPRSVGEHVLRAIRANHLYVLTHPEYRPLVEARIAAIRGGFGASAEPGYTDPQLVLSRSANPEYLAAPRAGVAEEEA
jgi:NAD(P)-dependent dehydrogenase (short-subunit alcohol dehydrogenase family)